MGLVTWMPLTGVPLDLAIVVLFGAVHFDFRRIDSKTATANVSRTRYLGPVHRRAIVVPQGTPHVRRSHALPSHRRSHDHARG